MRVDIERKVVTGMKQQRTQFAEGAQKIRYEEWLPGPGLEGIVTAYWSVAGDTPKGSSPVILPDGHIEVVFNLGDRVTLEGPAYTGDQPDRVVVGPLSRAVRMKYEGQVHTFGIRFHPARGASFLGKAAPTLTDKLVPLAEICFVLDRVLRQLLVERGNMASAASRAALDGVLLEQLPLALPPDYRVVTLVDRLTHSKSSPLVSHVARELGLSSRQLQRRFLAAVGMPPKRFARVLRFARVWQLATMSPPETWGELSAAHGYADQAHMVREFRAFGAEPPTRLFTPDWYGATELSRVSGPAKGVRTVQDRVRKPAP
jgi:AraC-like DNA-binding protein